MTEAYVELHAASAFSLLQAASQPKSLIERAAALDMPAIALLDHNGVYGAARFHTSAKRSAVRAHIGAEISVASFGPRLTPPAWLPHQHPNEPARLPLLCASREGYQNLCQLITQFKMREATKKEGAANFDDLGQYASGLICLTGGDEGPLAAALARGGETAAQETVEQLTRIFGRANVYVELQRHREREEEWRNQAAIRIARSLNLPLIATNGVRYAAEYDREIQDLFTAIRHHVELDRAGRLLAINNLRYLRTAPEMAALFCDVPGAVENTVDLSSRLGFELDDLVANFSGAKADELRRAVGMRRSWERMKNLEGELRAGMTANGLDAATQETIIQNISSFALYGFPESHAASFALIAYASAYFKVKYLAAFTAAILNNQPMGFYSPAVLVKDAQRHGLRVKPIDIQVSEWACTIEHEADGVLSLRMGLGYAKGLRRQSAEAAVAVRWRDGLFGSTEDLALRVPMLNRKELTLLARVGALNKLDGIKHRRDALWQVERAGKLEGPLLRQQSDWLRESSDARPLQQMDVDERLVADYAGTGLTIGKHPMYYQRSELRRRNILSAGELRTRRDGEFVRTAGCVIAQQRPGTAKGFIFISMEDETGIANVIVTPDLYERDRLVVTRSRFLLVEGPLQNQDNVIHVKAVRLTALSDRALEMRSHDFH